LAGCFSSGVAQIGISIPHPRQKKAATERDRPDILAFGVNYFRLLRFTGIVSNAGIAAGSSTTAAGFL
jgi:hypothetical protein